MKNEMFYGYEHTFHTLDELEKTMEEYIEYYNKHRIIIKLKGLTPVEYRNQSSLIALNYNVQIIGFTTSQLFF